MPIVPPAPPNSISTVEPFPLFRIPSSKTTNLHGGIYAIVCVVNHHVYIGKSENIRLRLRGHRGCLLADKHPSKRMADLYKDYGPSVFMVEILEICDPVRAKKAEAEHMHKYYKIDPEILMNHDVTLARNYEQSPKPTSYKRSKYGYQPEQR